MVYLAGVIGFIGGFFIGQVILMRLLKNYSNEEILENKSLRWTYGMLNWVIAGLGSYSVVMFYNHYGTLFK